MLWTEILQDVDGLSAVLQALLNLFPNLVAEWFILDTILSISLSWLKSPSMVHLPYPLQDKVQASLYCRKDLCGQKPASFSSSRLPAPHPTHTVFQLCVFVIPELHNHVTFLHFPTWWSSLEAFSDSPWFHHSTSISKPFLSNTLTCQWPFSFHHTTLYSNHHILEYPCLCLIYLCISRPGTMAGMW